MRYYYFHNDPRQACGLLESRYSIDRQSLCILFLAKAPYLPGKNKLRFPRLRRGGLGRRQAESSRQAKPLTKYMAERSFSPLLGRSLPLARPAYRATKYRYNRLRRPALFLFLPRKCLLARPCRVQFLNKGFLPALSCATIVRPPNDSNQRHWLSRIRCR